MSALISNNTSTNGSANLNQVCNDSQSFSFLEYFLRLSLHSSTVKIVDAWEVSNPQLTLQFEKRAKDLSILQSWVDASSLLAGNVEDEVVKRGFQFGTSSNNGMKFSIGHIKLNEHGDNNANQGIIRRKMLLCKVAVGRSYNATDDFAKIANIPEGYDSFVLDKEGINLQKVENQESSMMTTTPDLEYIIKDASQILPTFVIVFELDPEAERRSRQKSNCDNCESSPATVFCQADSANLCSNCDAHLHSSKLTSRHQRTPLEAGPQTFSCCKHHPDKMVEFFCPSCSKPVCVHCKMIGHHSTGDAARHKLITVSDAFKGVSEAAKANDPLLEARKIKINTQMTAVVERAKAVESNATEIQQQLEDIYKKALSDLKSITKKKLNILKGDMTELHREHGEIRQVEAFLEYQASGGNATQFILDWASHQRLRGELYAFPHFRETIDVHSDIKINGGIQVHVEAAGAVSLSPYDGTTLCANDSMATMRGSGLFDRPRYAFSTAPNNSPTNRSRVGATTTTTTNTNATAVDFSSLTKTSRKATEVETILGVNASISPLSCGIGNGKSG